MLALSRLDAPMKQDCTSSTSCARGKFLKNNNTIEYDNRLPDSVHTSYVYSQTEGIQDRPLLERNYTFHWQGIFCPVPSVGHAALPVSAGQTGWPLVPVPGW